MATASGSTANYSTGAHPDCPKLTLARPVQHVMQSSARLAAGKSTSTAGMACRAQLRNSTDRTECCDEHVTAQVNG